MVEDRKKMTIVDFSRMIERLISKMKVNVDNLIRKCNRICYYVCVLTGIENCLYIY